ncbi:hypothetical protein ACQP06_25350 [Nocardia sp. CA-136227]|uniref:hypothetical protein n=1 Tax=Nocardia sp. CA-136227 TaxID=3239979 RepID=UPI003D99AE28
MTTLWLPFLLGLTAGITLTCLLPLISRPTHPPTTDGWTVADITSRLELERDETRRGSASAQKPLGRYHAAASAKPTSSRPMRLRA